MITNHDHETLETSLPVAVMELIREAEGTAFVIMNRHRRTVLCAAEFADLFAIDGYELLGLRLQSLIDFEQPDWVRAEATRRTGLRSPFSLPVILAARPDLPTKRLLLEATPVLDGDEATHWRIIASEIDPEAHARAVEIDRAARSHTAVPTEGQARS